MSPLRIREEDLKLEGIDSGGSEKLSYEGKPFSGVMLIYEDDGWRSAEIDFENGFREGWERYYFENGQLEEEYKTHNNIMVADTYSRFDEEGNLLGSM